MRIMMRGLYLALVRPVHEQVRLPLSKTTSVSKQPVGGVRGGHSTVTTTTVYTAVMRVLLSGVIHKNQNDCAGWCLSSIDVVLCVFQLSCFLSF